MNFGRTAAKSDQLGVSSAGAIFIVIAFLSGLCFNVPEYICGMLKDAQKAELCARPLISSRPRTSDSKDTKFVVVIPQSVNDDALLFNGVAK